MDLSPYILEREQLQQDLADPEIEHIQRGQKAKRLQALEEIINLGEQINSLEKEVGGLEELLLDPEFEQSARQEKEAIESKLAHLKEEFEDLIIPSDPLDDKNVILEIRAGVGGDEAALFASDLLRMYLRFAEIKGWKTEVLSHSQNSLGGTKEVILRMSGPGVNGNMKFESGVHRIQRVPETEKSGRVHTSTATVAVLPEAEDVDIEIKPEDLRVDVFRSGGKGGQSVNTTDSAVRLTHIPTGIVVSMQDERSQVKNKDKAMKILRSRLFAAEQEKLQKERGQARKSQVGTGDRSEKIRTYNIPQDRVTDHRIKMNFSDVQGIFNGNLEEVIVSLKQAEKELRKNEMA